jgi:hypothetical protein
VDRARYETSKEESLLFIPIHFHQYLAEKRIEFIDVDVSIIDGFYGVFPGVSTCF